MNRDIIKAFQKVIYHPERQLSDGILLAIKNREKRNTVIKLWTYSTIGVFSLLGLFPVVKLLIKDITSSGLYEYISLAFSDIRFLSYWKEITLSITESLPMTSLILSLTLVFIFVLSLRFMARNIRVRPKLLTL